MGFIGQTNSVLEQHFAVLGQWPQVVLDQAFEVIGNFSHGNHCRNDEITEGLALMVSVGPIRFCQACL